MSLFPRDNYDDDHGTSGPFIVSVAQMALLAVQLFFLLLLSTFPINLWHFNDVRPAFILMAVYYWSVYRPLMLPPFLTFIVGMILDLLYAGPLGLNAVTLLAVQWLTKRQRRLLAGQSFIVLWLGFFVVSGAVFITQWLAFSLFHMTWAPVKPMVAAALLTGFVFPLMLVIFRAFSRRIGRRGLV